MPQFEGRIWLSAESVEDVETWCYELEPVDRLHRISTAEWAGVHIRESYSLADLRDQFKIAETGCYQIIFKAELAGHYDYWGEYDEDLVVSEFSFVKLPDDWFDPPVLSFLTVEEPDDGPGRNTTCDYV